MKIRPLDVVLAGLIFLLAVMINFVARQQKNMSSTYQMNSNYVANLNECRRKTTEHDWMFQVSGITDYVKNKYGDN